MKHLVNKGRPTLTLTPADWRWIVHDPMWRAVMEELTGDEFLDLCGVERRPWGGGRKKSEGANRWSSRKASRDGSDVRPPSPPAVIAGSEFEDALADLHSAVTFALECQHASAAVRKRPIAKSPPRRYGSSRSASRRAGPAPPHVPVHCAEPTSLETYLYFDPFSNDHPNDLGTRVS